MRSVVVESTGGPEALQIVEGDTPVPGPGEVLIEVAAAGVNFIDTYQRSGVYPMQTPFVVGSEGAGVVAALGEGVTGLAVGDHVAWAMLPGTGYTTHAVVPADSAIPVPEGVSDEAAAAVLLQGMTAHFLSRSTVETRAGQTALVHAAAGGVGLLLTQMLTARGVRVIATTSTDAKAELARGAGASEVIRYDQEDLVGCVRELTDGRGVDVVYDGVGKDTFDASLDCLAPRGYMVLFGGASGQVPPLDPQVLNRKGSLYLTRPSLGAYIATPEELRERAGDVLGWVADGSLDVRIGATYPLEEAGRAHAALEGRETTGKVLLRPRG